MSAATYQMCFCERPGCLSCSTDPDELGVLADVGVVSCAGCGVDLLGERSENRLHAGDLEPVADVVKAFARGVGGRLKGRPYCGQCLLKELAARS